MEIIKNFGIDPVLLAAQIINFFIIFLILKKFLYKPVFDLLRKRESIIKEGFEKAEEAQKTLEKALESEKETLKKVQVEAIKLINDAKNEATQILKNSENQAKTQTEKMINQAKEQITQEAQEAEKQLTKKISVLAIEFLQKGLQQLFSEKEQEEIIMRAIKKIKQKPN